MGKKYVMTGSFLDGFKASFTKKECILAEKHYPLGYFAVKFLEADRTLLRKLERLVPIFQEEFTVFLSARDPSSAALAQQALNAVWDVLIQMPVYRHLEQHSGGVRGLLREMKESPELVDEMLTPGTGRSEMLHEWLRRLATLPESIWDFILSTEKRNSPASSTTTSVGVWRREIFRAGVNAADAISWRWGLTILATA